MKAFVLRVIFLGLTLNFFIGFIGTSYGFTISGKVIDADTLLGVPNIGMNVYDSNGNWVQAWSPTDSQGNYTSSGNLTDGTYYMRTQNEIGYFDELYGGTVCNVGTCDETAGTPIIINGSDVTNIDFTLTGGGGTISGYVFNPNTGNPLGNIAVFFYDENGVYVTHDYTWTNGGFVSNGGLVSGTYYARTENSPLYEDELYDNISCPAGNCNVVSGTPINVTLGAESNDINFMLSYNFNNGLMAYYPFNSSANDESGNNNNGTAYGAILTTDRFGNQNSAYSFDGINDIISVPHSNSLNIPANNPLTMVAWISKSSEGDVHVLGKRNGCGGDQNFYQMAIASAGGISPALIPLNTWTHIAVTFDGAGNTRKRYVNGTLIQTDSGTVQENISDFRIGGSGGCAVFHGSIDEVRIYNRALSDAAISELVEVGGQLPENIIFKSGFENVFKECQDCPVMKQIPSGSFQMGDISGTGVSFERPVHSVSIASFAIGENEITFDEWDACFLANGCSHYTVDSGFGRGNRPVIDVSWNDIQEYTSWLNTVTNGSYRLPSEAEWEYAARANTSSLYWFGDTIGSNLANCDLECGDSFEFTAPIQSFLANSFGLYEVSGNVWEWTEDCWHVDYIGAPTDGSAWLTGDCSKRVIRGGSWVEEAFSLRSASRWAFDVQTTRHSTGGFRVAKDMN